ncbi:ribbon-helix-helix protein, CopG family [Clostridium sp. BSD2780061688st1 E8]|uniref:CopG family ribbon-helix-helix protein n=1 Tax=Clostridia TaxID=186801 RepID=UPI0008204A0E|nr:ribbon-helix-helix protein, CopG family [Clostridium sp. BSD2780061688st1 E8]SCJ69475.1 EndoA inhibitor [uncultured Clostridium sp.]
MPQLKKILISLPDSLLAQADQIARDHNVNRSELIREAMRAYISEKQRELIRQQMREGYESMAQINRDWAEWGMAAQAQDSAHYEALLAESE